MISVVFYNNNNFAVRRTKTLQRVRAYIMGHGRNKNSILAQFEFDFATTLNMYVKYEIEISLRTLRLLNEERALVYIYKKGAR